MRLRIHGRRFELYIRIGSPPLPIEEIRQSWLINGTRIPDVILESVPVEMHDLLKHRVKEIIRAGYEHDPSLDEVPTRELWKRLCSEINWQIRMGRLNPGELPEMAQEIMRIRNSLMTQNYDVPWRSRAGGRSLPVVCLEDATVGDECVVSTASVA